MSWLDWTIAAIALAFVIEGLAKGLTRVLIGLLSLLAGLFLAAWFYGVAAAMIQPYVSHASLAKGLGFFAIFVGVQLMGAALAWLLQKVWQVSLLSWLDRLLGGAFGLLKGALTAVVLLMVITAFPLKPVPEAVSQSRIAPYLLGASGLLVNLAPRELKAGFTATYDRIKQLWASSLPRTSA